MAKQIKPEQIDYNGYTIVVEPHEQGSRVVLSSPGGLHVTEHIGDKAEGIEKVKAYATQR